MDSGPSVTPSRTIRGDPATEQAAPVRGVSTVESECVAPDGADRLVAALAYIGVIPFLLFAGSPGRIFIRRHQHIAAVVHAIRVVWTGAVLAVWMRLSADVETNERLSMLGRDVAALVVAGVPWHTSFQTNVLPWILIPLVATWLVSLGGFYLALTGKTADFQAFTNADWSDPVIRKRWFAWTPEEERRLARLARDRHLEKIQRSTRTYNSERVRREQMTTIQSNIDQLKAQREHNDQLLALGEISQRRYDAARLDIDEGIAELQRAQSGLVARTGATSGQTPQRLRVSRTDRSAEALVNTVAIITPSGIPLFTYGKFALDDAIVAGILSAFDSLSEEVFGSRVNKTQLAEGQVLFFAHGQFVLILSIFDDDPSPRQVEQLKTMLRQFEQANQGAMRREQYDPAYLHEVMIPFKFIDARSSSSERTG
ncbi:hypothetical protein BH23CHL1_BH23CHL1_04200 [soil metagenome]